MGPLSAVYRHISKGAWPFSTRDHGWPISDCTSEGLKAALGLAAAGPHVGGAPIPAARLYDAVNIILSYQNHDGGWATYENTRSFHALEVPSLTSHHVQALHGSQLPVLPTPSPPSLSASADMRWSYY